MSDVDGTLTGSEIEELTSSLFGGGSLPTARADAPEVQATRFKRTELEALAARSIAPAFAFGNTATDAAAYATATDIPADRRFFFQFTDEVFGGRRIEAYTEVAGEPIATEAVCRGP